MSVVYCQVEGCNELITPLEESYPLRCVIVCDLETSWMRGPWPALGRGATRKKIITLSANWILLSRSGDITFVCTLPVLFYLGFSPLILSDNIVLPIPILPDKSFTFTQSVIRYVQLYRSKKYQTLPFCILFLMLAVNITFICKL